MDTIVTIAISVLAVLIVGGIVFIFLWLWVVPGKQYGVQKEQNELPDATVYAEELHDGFAELTSSLSDATALYDGVNGVTHLMSEELGGRTVGAGSQEEAEIVFKSYVQEELDDFHSK